MIVHIKNKKNPNLPHIVRSGDLMNFDPTELFFDKKADIIWADPPWGDGLMKYFQTQNRKLNPNETTIDWSASEFLERSLQICKEVMHQNSIMFLEYGEKHFDFVRDEIKKSGLYFSGLRNVNYFGGGVWRGHNLFILTKMDGANNLSNLVPESEELTNLGGVKMVSKCIKNIWSSVPVETQKELTIFDPCCGLGLAAEVSIKYGARFIGCELNPSRAKRTVERINKLQK